jgi:hypothetical protein
MYACTYVRMYVCMYVRRPMYVRTYVCLCVCVYVCMYATLFIFSCSSIQYVEIQRTHAERLCISVRITRLHAGGSTQDTFCMRWGLFVVLCVAQERS